MLTYASIDERVMPQIVSEHSYLLEAFRRVGIADLSTLELLLPLTRYTQLLGAAQLNAFELHTDSNLAISCLLPLGGSLFNHSCLPNVAVGCGNSAKVCYCGTTEIALS